MGVDSSDKKSSKVDLVSQSLNFSNVNSIYGDFDDVENSGRGKYSKKTSNNSSAVQGVLFSFSAGVDYEKGYRGTVAMKIAGITYRQLDYWARKHIIEPSITPSHGSGSRRLYSFKDIVIMTVAKKLLDAGVNLQNVTNAILFLYCHSEESLNKMTIICDGNNVQECDVDKNNILDMLSTGSAVFAINVGQICKRVESDLESENFTPLQLD